MPSRTMSSRSTSAALAAVVLLLASPAIRAGELHRPGDDRRYGDVYGAPSYGDFRNSYRRVDRYGGWREPGPDGDDGENAGDPSAEEHYVDGPDVGVPDGDERFADERYRDDRRGTYQRDGYTDNGSRHSYKDQPADESYDDRLPPPRRYSDVPRYPQYRDRPAYGCVPRREVRRALYEDGWFELQLPVVDGPVVLLRARRDSGRLFELQLDRCTGRVLHAEVISPRPRGEIRVGGPRRAYPTY